MTGTPPDDPKIYHILHIDRLSSVLMDRRLYSDAVVRARKNGGTVIGMQSIKDRRLRLPVTCHPGTHVGDYVPFYLCARSVMLFMLHKGNAPGLGYTGGQAPVITLEADLRKTAASADNAGIRWAFSLGNAGAAYQSFRNDLRRLDEINWPAVEARDFRQPDVKEGKQAEFLVYERFPWWLVGQIGVRNVEMQRLVKDIMARDDYKPPVRVRPDWYY